MKTRIVRIGNSHGLRLPKLVLEQTGLSGEVELEVDGSCIIIRSPNRTRAGWSEAFRSMRANGDDALVDGDVATSTWDEAEWQW